MSTTRTIVFNRSPITQEHLLRAALWGSVQATCGRGEINMTVDEKVLILDAKAPTVDAVSPATKES